MRPQDLFASLEPRLMLAAFTVTNLNGDGPGSLRQAVLDSNAAPGADTVDFAPSVFGTIPLGGSELNITDPLTINGPGSSSLILDAGGTSRILTVQGGVTATLNGLRMINGSVGDNGAGIRNFGNLTINNSSIVGNTSGSSGAGIYSTGNLTLDKTVIGGNTSNTDGGGIHIADGTATVTNSSITENSADASAAGIFNEGTLNITGSAFTANIASIVNNARSGGGIFTLNGAVNISNSTFSGNVAGAGGAIHDSGGTLSITNSTFSGNVANFAGTGGGGAILLTGATATIRNSTIASNTSTDAGGGIFIDPTSTAALTSTLVGGNLTVATANDIGGTLENVSANNLIQDSLTAGGLVNGASGNILGVDPLLAPLASNGGPTMTRALLAGSPAIAMGSNPGALLTDQRQGPFLRTTTTVDIGAYQRQSLAMVVDITADESDGNFAAGDLSLREAIEAAGPNPGNDSISFAPALNGQTLALTLGELAIVGDLTLTGPGSTLLTLSAGNISRVFSIAGGSVVTMSGLSITNGRATANAGGGINNSGTLTLTGASLSGNTAGNTGGAINNSGQLTVTDTNISGNTAIDGGGIHNTGTFSLTRTAVFNNTATGIGGGIYSTNRFDIGSAAITGNTALAGGGIFSSGNLNLVGVTLDNNAATADMGGGIYATAGTVTIYNSTITRNNSALNGGGVAVSLIPTRVISTIIAGNKTADVLNDVNATFDSASTHNLISDTANAGGLTNGVNSNIVGLDPVVGPLAFNGGPTQTVALLAGSPGINAGANPNTLTTDQRGLPRLRGTAVDIGAFEFSSAPALAGVTASSLSLAQGDALLLTATGASDADGTVSVSFYVDRNNDGVADAGELLGTDNTAGDGFTYALTGAQSGTLPTGAVKFLAVAVDTDAQTSATVQTAAASTVIYSVRSGAGDTVSGFANPGTDSLTVGTVNSAGNPLVFEAASPWNARDLAAQTGAPAAIDNLIVWVDPKDNLTYAAYPSADGLILLRRAADGAWSFRNLNTELNGSQKPTKSLTQFASANGTVVIAGLMDDGKILAFTQTSDAPTDGNYAYSFINITDTDLAPQGFASPVVQKLISYRPSWDAWHLAGIDEAGKIWSVWVSPSTFTRWRSDDLSAITGAPAVSKGLSVLLTSWGGINLTALDSAGKVSVTWWVPEFGADWNNNNLSDETPGAATLTSLTGYYSSWDGMNYTGLNEAGEIVVYWWVPSFGGTWVVSDLTGGLPAEQPRPVTDLTAHASAQGTFNIFGAAANGDVVRTWWSPAANQWTLEDLSATATRL